MKVKTKCRQGFSKNNCNFIKGQTYFYEYVGRKYRVYQSDKRNNYYVDFSYKDFLVYFI